MCTGLFPNILGTGMHKLYFFPYAAVLRSQEGCKPDLITPHPDPPENSGMHVHDTDIIIILVSEKFGEN